jgi:HD superfamily phosphohydrolase
MQCIHCIHCIQSSNPLPIAILLSLILGIDVDKWDYLKRDEAALNVGVVFNYERFIKYSKILKTGNPNRRRICIRKKENEMVDEMFADRARLHKYGYQHRVTKIIGCMLVSFFDFLNVYFF